MSSKKFKTVVFICTANYYRSRFSRVPFQRLGQEVRASVASNLTRPESMDGGKRRGNLQIHCVQVDHVGVPLMGNAFPFNFSRPI